MIQRAPLAFWLTILASTAFAQEAIPVARVTIYPGDVIVGSMIEERNLALTPGTEGRYALSREALVGKAARRTLLPGQPIPVGAIDSPRIVAIGAQIKLVFDQDGLQIIAFGIAQQAGGVGDLIRVRNQESGIFVTGRIQADGSVRVGEG
jgi:flagellar basal body P-ring formation protein FlgA